MRELSDERIGINQELRENGRVIAEKTSHIRAFTTTANVIIISISIASISRN